MPLNDAHPKRGREVYNRAIQLCQVIAGALGLMTSSLEKFLAYVDGSAHRDGFKQRLSDAVARKSVSSDPSLRPDVQEMGNWLESQLKAYGADTMQVNLNNIVKDPPTPPLPNLILASIGTDPEKKTVLIYGHYDVQPAKAGDPWETTDKDPFKLTFKDDGRMVGRGSTDDKGPIMGWINVLEAHYNAGLTLPVNLRFCFEGMEEVGSQGLNEFLATDDAKKYFEGVTSVCISDNYWLTTHTPAVTYGLRGIMYFTATLSGPKNDLHSGIYGGMVYEPLIILTRLLASLTSNDGTILVPGVNEHVKPLTSAELKLYEDLQFTDDDLEQLKTKETGDILVTENKVNLLMKRMRYPSLSLHGIAGGTEEEGTIIPREVVGKFSIRLVPDQTPENLHGLVESYLQSQFQALHTKCSLTVQELSGSAPPWLGDVTGPSFTAAKQAIEAVYGKMPDFTREGGSIDVALTFSEVLGVKDVVLLPMGRSDDGAHSVNEKLDEENFFKGTKVMGTFLYKLSEL